MSAKDWFANRLTVGSTAPIIIGTGSNSGSMFDTFTRTAASGTVHTWPSRTAAGSGYWDSSRFGASKTFSTSSSTWAWPSTVEPWNYLTPEDEKLIEEFLIESFARGFAKEQAA